MTEAERAALIYILRRLACDTCGCPGSSRGHIQEDENYSVDCWDEFHDIMEALECEST